MNQLFGQSAISVSHGEDGPTPATGVRAFATPARADRAWFHLDLRRSLGMHWGLALGVAIIFAVLAVLYFMDGAIPLKPWPAYQAESIVDVKQTPATILPNLISTSKGEAQELPFDGNTFETYFQQQMTNVRRNDVLLAALHKLNDFQREGESNEAAAQRLASRLEVTREGSAYRFSIGARAESPGLAAQIANAVTAAYMESPTRDLGTGKAQRLQIWKQELDRIQSAMAADRTEQRALNAHSQNHEGTATGVTSQMQRSSDLTAQIARLQARYAMVDAQLHDPKLEDGAPAVAYQVTLATPPLGRPISVVSGDALLIAAAGVLLGVLAAVCVHKLDPRVYIGADVERVLGFAPLAQLPNFSEVSDGAAEEYTLRLASAIEQGRKLDNLKNCIFTGTGAETGVSTLVKRVAAMLEAMGTATVLADATGAQAPAPVERLRRSPVLQKTGGETKSGEDSLMMTDTAPLAVSAETEYLARFADCAIVVIASGVTTRAELREAARTFERLKVAAVGFVLNRVGLKKADAAFRTSVEGVERHLRIYGKPAAIRNERRTSFAPDRQEDREALSVVTSASSLLGPAVTTASVARFPASSAAKLEETLAAYLSAPRAESVTAGSSAMICEPVVSVGAEKIPWPAAEAASPMPAAQEKPSDRAIAAASQMEPEAAKESQPERPAKMQEPEVPSWLMESIRNREPERSQSPQQLEKMWTARRPSTDEAVQAAAQSLNVDPQKFRQAFEQWRDALPGSKEASRSDSTAGPEEARKSDLKEANGNVISRLSTLKNLLVTLGAKDGQSGEASGEHHSGGVSFDSKSDWAIPEDGASRADEVLSSNLEQYERI